MRQDEVSQKHKCRLIALYEHERHLVLSRVAFNDFDV